MKRTRKISKNPSSFIRREEGERQGPGLKKPLKEAAMRKFAKLWRDEMGATAIEYGLVLTIVGLAVIGGMTLLGNAIGNMMTKAGNKLP